MSFARPELCVFVGGAPRCRLGAPRDFGSRDWILGVVAVQVGVEEGRVRARLRVNRTGSAAIVEPLANPSLVQVALVGEAEPPPALPALAPPRLDAEATEAMIALFVDDAPTRQAVLPPARLAHRPPPRAFGHVYCRWLRDGADEPGFDLTDFLSLPGGVKYTRIAGGTLDRGRIVSYAIACR